MALALKDLIKKAEEKGFEKIRPPSPIKIIPLSPWQQESVLYTENDMENKSDNKSGNIIDNNQGTIREHIGNNSGTHREQSGVITDNNQVTIQGTIREHKDIKLEIETGNELGNDRIKLELLRLSGIQENLFRYAFDLCLSREDGTTGFILTQSMSETIKCSYESAKISLKRLISKGLIIRLKGKTSRGGFIILSVPKEIKTLVLQLKLGSILGNELGNKTDTAVSSYSSSNKITTIGEGWDEINFSALGAIGFRKNHLLQLKTANAPEIVQESINHFAFALQTNKKVQGYETPLNVFMTVLKRGEGWVEPNYVSPRERAIQRHIESKKAEQARAEQAAKELFDLEFKAWESSLTEDERKSIAPDRIPGEAIVKLRAYFKETKWQEIKKSWS